MPSLKSSFAGVLLVSLVTLTSACGANASVVGRTTTKSSATTTTLPTTSSTSTTTGPASSTTIAPPPSSTTERTSASTTAFCDAITRLNAVGDDITSNPPDLSNPGAYLASLQRIFAEFATAVGDLDSHAPSEIKADADYLKQIFDRANALVQNVSSIEALRSAQAIRDVSSDETNAHVDKVSAFAQRSCGFGFSDGGGLTTV